MTGYLTQAGEVKMEAAGGQYEVNEKMVALCIPNEEVKTIFKKTIVDWFMKEVQDVYKRQGF